MSALPSAGDLTEVEVQLGLRSGYRVRLGPGALAELPRTLAGLEATRIAVLTDENVQALHGERLGALASAPRLAVAPGEDAKSMRELERVLDFLVAADLDRRSVLVAFGGGVVGDLGGLAASLYMRGIACVQCPTTLLAMVDSSVGGKTAVNLAGGKNLAGTFHQPQAVLADTETLRTLPAAERRSGLGEIIKSALVGDAELFERLERDALAMRTGDATTAGLVIAACVRVKARIVAADERENGQRKALNLGHTFAHAIEHVAGYGTIPHGVAVAAGLALAARAAEQSGVLADPSLPERLEGLLAALELPGSLADLRRTSGQALPARALEAALRHDKKGRAGEPAFVLPRRAGEIVLDCALSSATLAALLE